MRGLSWSRIVSLTMRTSGTCSAPSYGGERPIHCATRRATDRLDGAADRRLTPLTDHVARLTSCEASNMRHVSNDSESVVSAIDVVAEIPHDFTSR